MTTAADDAAVEDAFEAHLAGRPVSGAAADTFPGLAAFSEAVRATATRPGRPSAALAELLVTGLLTDQSSPSARTARSAGSPPLRRSARVRIRRRTAMIFPVLLAKFLSAGAIAQAATGAGVAVVVVTGAGAAGALPGPLQNTVASVVETVTPFEVPTADEPVIDEPVVEEPVVEEPVVEEPVAEEPVVPEPPVDDSPVAFSAEAWAADGPDAYPSFGAWVSDGARNGAMKDQPGAFGALVSDRARAKGLSEEDLAAEGVDLDELTGEVPTEPAPGSGTVENEPAEAGTATTKGKGNGSGNGAAKGAGDSGAGGKGNGAQGAGNAAGKGNGRN